MSRTVKDFVGEWHIHWVDGVDPVLQPLWKLAIGTESPAFLNESYEVCVNFSILRPTADGGWEPVFGSESSQPLVLVDGHLRWLGTDDEGHPLRLYISIAEAVTEDQQTFLALYGSTLHGDPDQVAVWGGSDRPPGG
jgi:hypothetical protein